MTSNFPSTAGFLPILRRAIASDQLLEMAPKLPYIFHTSPAPSAHMEIGKDFYKELGVESLALIYIQDLAGIEYSGALKSRLEKAGVDVVIYESYPAVAPDLSPLLKKIKAAAPDALVAVTYPPDAFMITEQTMVIGLNPKLFCLGIGGAMPVYRNKFGASKLEGPVPILLKVSVPPPTSPRALCVMSPRTASTLSSAERTSLTLESVQV